MSATLRKAIADSGKSFKALERETGITRQSLMKFVAGTSLRLDIADRVAIYFGLELRPKKVKRE
jgi:hypothetical protein